MRRIGVEARVPFLDLAMVELALRLAPGLKVRDGREKWILREAYAGLVPTPWRSGTIDREQGISKAGNRRLRHIMIELAWLWVRHQPDSALTAWFRARVGHERGRVRRVTIVALARKLLLAVEHVGIEHFGRIELPAFGAGAKRKHNGQGRPETKQ